MVTVHRAHGLRFIIYTQDHEPAHVHVRGQAGEARISLREHGLVSNAGLSRTELRRAMAEVQIERERLLAEWERIHGPV
ncbi:DUF4160 domain-containing protein [Sandaracinobacteroides saxicola]|uniref:DUF4160 domain-containing protein n=1 Tax=Sandaracinobacteroides saxicola TaxID=2759707 RepID=A0A7G5IFF6_9SPHN|nr:DUF4160 domain-containing protein [Sandaracinobacteroides saxicola]QMW22098.1 DUF4160 domain-containing protein [Sandaracinobacteroides saxicola]